MYLIISKCNIFKNSRYMQNPIHDEKKLKTLNVDRIQQGDDEEKPWEVSCTGRGRVRSCLCTILIFSSSWIFVLILIFFKYCMKIFTLIEFFGASLGFALEANASLALGPSLKMSLFAPRRGDTSTRVRKPRTTPMRECVKRRLPRLGKGWVYSYPPCT